MSVYGFDVDLLRRLRAFLDPVGVGVVEVDGWQSRGRTYATFDPYGSVNHHTAGPRSGDQPSLGICINGRSDLPGPLCNVHQARSDHVNLVAAGVANHAGPGGWSGMKGNQSVFGLEVEHCGYPDEPFPARRYDISVRVHAAFLSGLDHPDTNRCCQHSEWSTQGKIDFCEPLLPGGPEGFRTDVAVLLRGGVPAPAPGPAAPGGGPPFPYPPGHYIGTSRPDAACHSGCHGDPDKSVTYLWQTQMANRGWTISLDGCYGPQSESVCRAFQAEKGLGVDGLVGPVTWAATWTAPVT